MCEPEFKPRADEPIIEICVNLRYCGLTHARRLHTLRHRTTAASLPNPEARRIGPHPATCICRTTSTKMDAKAAAARLLASFAEHGPLFLAWFLKHGPLLPRFEWGLLSSGWLHGENFLF
jgi:hypothetical protein